MGRLGEIKMEHDYTSVWTEEEMRAHTYVYCYTVYWKEKFNLILNTWYQKPFASKKDAKAFAKKKKDKSIRLNPYIIRKIVPATYFRIDVKVEQTRGESRDSIEVIKI